MQSRQFPIGLLTLIVSIAVINFLAEAYHWYWRMRWFDRPMHFAGGVWLAGMAIWLMYSRKGMSLPSFPKILATCLIAAFGVGLLWEIFETGLSLLTMGHINDIPNTISDLFFDTLGGAMAAILFWWQMPQKV